MASPEAFSGYRNRPDADARAIRDGWYLTGDLATEDDDGGDPRRVCGHTGGNRRDHCEFHVPSPPTAARIASASVAARRSRNTSSSSS